MGWRTTLGLAVVVGFMASLLFLGDDPEKGAPNAPTLTKRLLPKGIFEAYEVRFQHSSRREPIVIRRNPADGSFRVVEPVDDVASSAVLKSIFNAYDGAMLLAGYTADELKKDPELFEKTGLREPRGRFEVRYGADERVLIEFGDDGFQGEEIFVKVDGLIYRADIALHKILLKNPDDLRERVIFSELDIGQPTKVRISWLVAGDTREIAVQDLPGQGFKIVHPDVQRADMQVLGGMISDLAGLRIERFISGGQQPPDPPSRFDYVITVVGDRGQETLTVKLSENGRYFAHLRNREIHFSIDGGRLARIAQWATVLRAKRVFALEERQIQRLELVPGGEKPETLLVRGVQGVFHLEKPVIADEVEPTALSELLHALTQMEARAFVDDPPADSGLADGDPFFAVRVGTRRQMGGMTTVRLGNRVSEGEHKGLVYARRTDEESAVLIGAEMADAIRRPWLDFVRRYLPPMDVDAFWLGVTVPGQKDPIVYVNKDLGWRLDGEGDEYFDVYRLVDHLKKLRAKAVEPVASLRKDRPTVSLVFRREQHANSGEIYRLRMQAHEKDEYVRVQVVGRSAGVIYVIAKDPFRKLLDQWTG